MSNLHLTLACEDYDRTRPIKDGIVKPEGIELNYLVMPVEEIFWRMMKYEEFDVSELSMGAFLTAASRGRRPFIAIPVFPSRTFRHRCIFVNTDSGVQVDSGSARPAHGRAGIFHDRGGMAARHVRARIRRRAEARFTGCKRARSIPAAKIASTSKCRRACTMESRPDTTLNAMIESGEVAAMMSPRMPTCFLQGSPKVKRLFPNYRQVEMEYFKTTGLFPIMHVIVIKRSIYEKEPWVAQTLYKAFCEAKEICMRDLYDTNILRVSLPWTSAEYEDYARPDDDRLLALWCRAEPAKSRDAARLFARARFDQAEAQFG